MVGCVTTTLLATAGPGANDCVGRRNMTGRAKTVMNVEKIIAVTGGAINIYRAVANHGTIVRTCGKYQHMIAAWSSSV